MTALPPDGMSSVPRVSIVMPAYNQAAHLPAAVASLQAQTFTDWEAIVVDDGSTDNTAEVLAAIDEPRLRCIVQANAERSRARNTGIRASRSTLIAFLDADDYWLPAYLETQVKAMDANPECGLSFTGVYDVNATGEVVRGRWWKGPTSDDQQAFLAAMLIGNRIPTPGCAIVRTECLHAVGLFDPELRQGEDWDQWLRIALRYPIHHVPKPLMCYRRYNVLLPPLVRDRGGEAAYVYILEKSFAALRNSPLYALRPAALAQMHWRNAWMHYVLGDAERGQASLALAREHDPAFFDPPWEAWAESVAYMADELYDLSTPVQEGLAAINTLLDNLPPWAAGLGARRRRIHGFYWGLHLFRSYEERQWRAVLQAAPRAARADPRWLRNRGFVAITLKAAGALVMRRRAA